MKHRETWKIFVMASLDACSEEEEPTPGISEEGMGEYQEDAEVSEQGVNGPEEEERPGTSKGLSGTTG